MSTYQSPYSRNLSSDEGDEKDDNESSCKVGNRKEITVCGNARCSNEIIRANDKLYCSRDCFHTDELELDKPVVFKHVAIIGRGGTGLLKELDKLDNIKVRLSEQFGRVVKIDIGSRLKPTSKTSKRKSVKEKSEDEEERMEVEEEKRKLSALMNFSSDSDSSSSDAEDESEEEVDAEELGGNIFSRSVESRICAIHPPLDSRSGEKVKAYIINTVSPWELHLQTEEMIMKSNEIDDICNRKEGIDSRLVIPHWIPEIGGYCCAKYDDRLYRAKILEHVEGCFRVKYVDYGNVDLVKTTDVYQLNPEVALIPRQCILFRVANAKPLKGKTNWNSKVKRFTIDSLDGACVELEVEWVERGILHFGKMNILKTLKNEVTGDFGNVLVERKLAEADSFYVN